MSASIKFKGLIASFATWGTKWQQHQVKGTKMYFSPYFQIKIVISVSAVLKKLYIHTHTRLSACVFGRSEMGAVLRILSGIL